MSVNVIVMGKNNIGVSCTEILLKDSEINILGIIGHFKDSTEDGWQKSLTKYAIEENLSVLNPKRISTKILDELTNDKPLDYLFSFQYEKIIKKPILEYPRYGCVNIHFSYLPRNRGVSPIAWALIEGDTEFAVTIHYMDEGVDTGDIIDQEVFPIFDDYTAQILYEKSVQAGVRLFQRVIPKLKKCKYIGSKQDESLATYHSLGSLDFNNVIIDWDGVCEEVFNRIRAFIFPQFQLPATLLNGKRLFVSRVERTDESSDNFTIGSFPKPPDTSGIKVATRDKFILIKEFKFREEYISPYRLWKNENISKSGCFDSD